MVAMCRPASSGLLRSKAVKIASASRTMFWNDPRAASSCGTSCARSPAGMVSRSARAARCRASYWVTMRRRLARSPGTSWFSKTSLPGAFAAVLFDESSDTAAARAAQTRLMSTDSR